MFIRIVKYALPVAALCAPVSAAIYNESISGDLSNNQAAPTALALTVGTNAIIGNVNGSAGDSQDWIALTVPAGAQMTSYTHAAYSSTDTQGFTGFQIGSAFVGSTFSTGSYAGYTHFGPGATNPGVAGGVATTTLNQNLLAFPYMADNSAAGTAAGATGFTSPLGPGTYTFLIQQLGASTSYEFDATVAAVPEPSSLALAGAGVLAMMATRRNGRRRALGNPRLKSATPVSFPHDFSPPSSSCSRS